MSRKSKCTVKRYVRSASIPLKLVHRLADEPLNLETATEDELVKAYYIDGIKEAREPLILKVVPYAHQIADIFFFTRMPEYSLTGRSDLRGSAVVGALDAMRKFNPKYQVPFRIWLRLRISGEMIDNLRRLQDYPRVIAKNRREVKPLISKLKHKLNRNPTNDELCAAYGEDLRPIITDPLFASGVFNQCALSGSEDDEQTGILSQVEDKRTYTISSAAVDIEKIIHGVLARVGREDLWIVIYGYYFYGLNNSKIANAERCSVSTVVNRHHQALKILRDGLSREEWEELLKG